MCQRKFFLLILPVFILTSVLSQAKTWGIRNLPDVYINDMSKKLINPDNLVYPQAATVIDSILAHMWRETTMEIVPVVVDNISPKDPDEFATKLFRHWGIGKKVKNNGILVLVVVYQRKMVIRTGYGAEKILPDIIAGRIVTQTMVPLFKEGSYSKGLIQGLFVI